MQFDKLPFHNWFDQRDYDMLGSLKVSFLVCEEPINLSPHFKDFKVWLEHLQSCFAKGFKSRPSAQQNPLPWETAGPAADVFDEGTLGGHISYNAVVTPGPYSTGALEGLLVRDPEWKPPMLVAP